MSNVKVSILEKDGVELDGPEEYTLLAEDVPVDNVNLDSSINTVQDALELDNYSHWRIESGKVRNISANRQMAVHGAFELEGELILEGQLIVED